MSTLRYTGARTWEQRWTCLADDRRAKTGTDRFLQAALTGVAPVYQLGSWAHRLAYRTGLKRVERIDTPVVCVGNLALGGTGKTPVVAWLARRLREEGYRPVVVSRGYGGRAERFESVEAIVVSDGWKPLFPPELVGDEPVELATVLNEIPVVIGRRRAAAARLAERRFHPDVILLDDGFQHYALERDCNLVVLDASRPPGVLRQFPRGSLREGLRALRRADAVVLTRCDLIPSEVYRALVVRLRRRFPHLVLAATIMRPEGLATLERDVRWLPPVLAGRRAFLFCGVGNPGSVRRALESLEMDVVEAVFLPDHARVSAERMEEFRTRAREHAADFLVCTAKDAVKIPAGVRQHPDCPVVVVSSTLEFKPAEAEAWLLEHVLALTLKRRELH